MELGWKYFFTTFEEEFIYFTIFEEEFIHFKILPSPPPWISNGRPLIVWHLIVRIKSHQTRAPIKRSILSSYLSTLKFWHLFLSKKTPNNAVISQSLILLIILVVDIVGIVSFCFQWSQLGFNWGSVGGAEFSYPPRRVLHFWLVQLGELGGAIFRTRRVLLLPPGGSSLFLKNWGVCSWPLTRH